MSKDDLTPDRVPKYEAPQEPEHEEQEQPPEFALTDEEMQRAMEFFREEQNLLVGFVAGLLAAVLGAVVWAGVTVAAGYQIGWFAVGIGFAVGLAVRSGGKGVDPIFGVIGAALSLLGCVLGNVFTIAWFISVDSGMPVIDVLAQMDVEIALELIMESFQITDILFYGMAVYFGYRYALRELSMDDFNRALGKGS